VASQGIHPDKDLDQALANVKDSGGKVDHSAQTFIWVECKCESELHTVTVRYAWHGAEYKERKLNELREIFACLWEEGSDDDK
jgi:hypothetical protein